MPISGALLRLSDGHPCGLPPVTVALAAERPTYTARPLRQPSRGIQSAKLNGHDPYGYLKDVLERLPTQPASRVEELLPHRWTLGRN